MLPVLVGARPANPVDSESLPPSATTSEHRVSRTSFDWIKAGWPGIKRSITDPAADATIDPDVDIVSATPFAVAGGDGGSIARARRCLASAVYYEAASEGDKGERAVAQVVLNRVRHPAFPNSVCGVVYEGAMLTTGCQFSFTCDGSRERKPSRAGWARASQIADAALGGYVDPAVGWATHYHTSAVDPYWNASLTNVATIGAHIFYRWQGYWGTTKAFKSVYSGVEPRLATLDEGKALADGSGASGIVVAGTAAAHPDFAPLALDKEPGTDTTDAATARTTTFKPLGMARRDGGLKRPETTGPGKGA